MMFLEKLKAQFLKQQNKTAFCIDEIDYSYQHFYQKIVSIQQILIKNKVKQNDIIIVKTYNDIETYASILAIWFTGATFVPINPTHPKKRNDLILKQANPKLILSSKNAITKEIATKNISNSNKNLEVISTKNQHNFYILFTSGSTGIPKGVIISLQNISSFIKNFNANYHLNSKDKFLQIYDLTFDASVHCYLLPLFLGASIYTVSSNKIKYLEAYKLLEKHKITFAKFPPSVLSYLKPFFNKINLPKLKYSLLGGESLNFDLVKQWQKCVPNATIQNVYGPTEATINTHVFTINNSTNLNKTYNGTVSIGKPFGENKAIIINKNNLEVKKNSKGELCLFGNQITSGYYKNELKNKHSFFTLGNKRFYKTGDLAFVDNDGDYIFCGRIDNQVQIQGYRVELSEVEHAARQTNSALNYCVVSLQNKYNVLEIILFTEQLEIDSNKLLTTLKAKLPNYMIPSKIKDIPKFPMTSSGKIDKQLLITKFL